MEQKKYYEHDLKKMSVYQLQEIARREKIIPAVVNRLNKELLIKTILRYRGVEKALLINEFREDDYQRLEKVFERITFQPQKANLNCTSGINVWQGLATDFFDKITLDYSEELAGTNAFIVDSEKNLCCVFNVEAKKNDKKFLYLRRNRYFPCHESEIKNYTLVFLERVYSEQFFHFYQGDLSIIPENMPAFCLHLLDFRVNEPQILKMPIAIDFGTSTTTAGILDFQEKISAAKFNNHRIKYAVFYNDDGEEVNVVPTVLGVRSLKNPENPEYIFGYDALKFESFFDENFTIFSDIKRWISDYEKEEELIDNFGRRIFVKRKTILREFFLFVIRSLEDYVKGKIKQVHISSPVKQKGRFQYLFKEILPEYAVEKKEMIDESVAVLYNTISELIESKTIRNKQKYSALVIDCGGGTTDISSCSFKVENRRVSYAIEIETGYENGNTDFGGDNLTYKVLQMLKLKIVEVLCKKHLEQNNLVKAQRAFYGEKDSLDEKTFAKAQRIPALKDLLKDFHLDVYRFIDENGVTKIYQDFENAYEMAEEILPTKFKYWEAKNRSEYLRVRNNYCFLSIIAEQIKREFFKNYGIIKVLLTVEGNHFKPDRNWELNQRYDEIFENTIKISLDKWKLTIKNSDGLNFISDLPDISFNIFEIEPILNPEIYNIIRQLFNPIYESGELENYGLIKLSGQSCKINLFKTALKEFVPGKLIKSKPKPNVIEDKDEFKMSCIDGALKYLRDKKFGYADIKIKNRPPHLPYILTGFTHSGEEINLIDGTKKIFRGFISRNIEDLTLPMYLKDREKNLRHEIIYQCSLEEFEKQTQEDIEKLYGEDIPQDETDNIVNGEVKFFVRVEPQDWGFMVVPIFREDENLFVGYEKFFSFENDIWVKNFFDGLK